MANPFGGSFEDARRIVGDVLNDVVTTADEINRDLREAQRTGQKLAIPQGPRQPVIADEGTRLDSELRAARGRMQNLEREFEEARKGASRLSEAQRRVLREVAEAQGMVEAGATTRGRAPGPNAEIRTYESLVRRGLLAPTTESHKGPHIATSRGLGFADPSLIQGDIIQQQRYIAGLEERVEKERALADEQERQRRAAERTPLRPRDTAGGGGRAVVEAIDRREEQELERRRQAYERRRARTLRPRESAGGGAREVLAAIDDQLRAQEALERAQASRAQLNEGEVRQLREAVDRRRQLRELEVREAPERRDTLRQAQGAQLREAVQRTQTLLNLDRQRQAVLRDIGSELQRMALPGVTTPLAPGAAPPPGGPPWVPPAPPGGGGGAPPDEPPRPPQRRVIAGVEFLSAEEVERAYEGTKNAEGAVTRYEDAIRRAAAADADYARASREANVEVSRAVTQYSALSNAMRRHGAATTEFLSSLGAGQTTIGELGWQATATAAKFAAWTAASVGVYGALGGIMQLGQGAVNSMSGINELSRFISDLDTDKAQQQFRDLSREFNLPIEDVTQAFAQMGRVFNDQDQAFEAARSTLLAVRVGELEVADATRFLSAIYQGFKIDAADTGTVIDQINQAQNRLNFSVRDGTAGIARAAGNWRAAGGTFSELLAIMATAQRTTGATGEVVGTAFRRSAEFIGREENRARLRAFNINPNQGIDAIYRQAFARVQSGEVQGQDITRLATALSSPQLAAVIGPTLQNFELYRRALRETNEEAARGSARNELAIQLDSIRERLRRTGTELEQLGSNLAQSGMLDGLVLALNVVNELLESVNDLVGAFNSITPEPLRHALAAAVQLYAVTRLMRRLNVGQSLIENAAANPDARRRNVLAENLGPFLRDSPARQVFRQLERNLNDEINFHRARIEGLGRRAADLAVDRQAAVRRQRQFQEGGPDIPEGASLRQRARLEARFNEEAADAKRRVQEIENLQRATAQEVDEAIRDVEAARVRQTNINQVRRRRGDQAALDFAEREYGPESERPIAGVVPTFDRPTEKPVTPIGDAVREQQANRVREVVDESDRVLNEAIEEGVEEGIEATSRGGRDAGRTGDRVGERTSRGRRALNRAGSGMRAAGAGMRGLALSMGAFLGPVELAIAGALFLPEIINSFQERARQRREQMDRLRTPSLDPQTYERRLDESRRLAEDIQRTRAERERFLRDPQSYRLPSGVRLPPGAVAPTIPADENEEQALRVLEEEQNRQREQLRAREEGRTVPFRFLDEIRDDFGRRLKRITETNGTIAEVEAAYRTAVAEARQSMEAERGGAKGDEQTEALIAELEQRVGAMASPATMAAIYRTQSLAEISAEMEREALAVEQFGTGRDRFRRAIAAQVAAAEELGTKTDPGRLQEAQRINQAVESMIGQQREEFEEQMGRASTRAGQRQALTRNLSILQSGANEARRQREIRRRELERARQAEARAERENEAAQNALRRGGLRAPRRFGGGTLGPDPLQTLRRDAAAAEAALEQARNRVARAEANERTTGRAFAEAVKSIQQARADLVNAFLQNTALIDAETALEVSQLRDPAARAQAQLRGRRRVANEAAALRRQFPNNQQIRIQAINAEAQANEAEIAAAEAATQAVNEEISRMDLRTRLAAARAPEGRRGGILLAGLRAQLARAQQAGADEETVGGLQLQILEQQEANAEEAKRLAEEAREKRRQNIQSLFELRRSQTDDPRRLTDLDVREAVALRRVAGDRNERRSAQATENEARRRRAEVRRDREIEDAELYRDIGRIGDAQLAEVYERAIRDRRTGAEYRRQLRHRLLRLRHQMNNESDFADLDVGNIQVPTAYDIRRFVEQGTHTAPRLVSVTQTNHIEVPDAGNPEATARAVLRAARTTGAAAMRSGGLA